MMEVWLDRINDERRLICDRLTSLFERQSRLNVVHLLSNAEDVSSLCWSHTLGIKELEHRKELDCIESCMAMYRRRLLILSEYLNVFRDMDKGSLKEEEENLKGQYFVSCSDRSYQMRARLKAIQMRLQNNI